MLVVHGFLENGVFIPEKSLANIKGRQKAVLSIEGVNEEEKQERLKAWQEFSQLVRSSNEVLEGEPERLCFKTPEEIENFENIEGIQVVNWIA